MSPEKQRISIAAACGWTDIRRQRLYLGDQDWWGTKLKSGEKHRLRLPDYITDLNACNEMEKVLTEHQNESIYPRNLGAWRNPTKAIYATAAQRCEAFLRTLGLWEKEANEPRTEEADVATVSDPLADMRARAEAGDVNAQRTLGDAYAHGMEVEQDRVESDRWYAMFSAPLPTEDAQ